MRIGQGYDVHKLVEGRRLILCGVPVPHSTGLLGHSDADVAVHALMDAILGALALGDIGQLFPDTDPAWKDADSMELLKAVMADPRVSEWEIGNLDLTIIAQKPKLLPFNLEMRTNLARGLDLPLDRVSVKATTTEKLGFEGREEGIAATCVVLLEKTVGA
ncbi:2-C-methyl-D-erythritol 2,4-cyclodiphosphate synthase [uncultured Victivallis sp.]|uniref:2-C-methyl-D-erythritol 2,4-cyclodiphosphate synthase n=1 Tax=uncultured Victivallis sp. TaxID=354118 RepID=UPI0034591A53